MTGITIQKLDKKTVTKAQLMYFGDYDITEIAASLSIEPDTVRFYVYGTDGEGKEENCWYQIKKKLKPTAIAIFLKDKAHVFEQTSGLALDLLNRSLVKMREEQNSEDAPKLSLDDMTKLAKIAVDMDKLYRLESGLATEQIDHMGLSIAQAKEVLANDPFANDVEVEFEELPWLKNEEEPKDA